MNHGFYTCLGCLLPFFVAGSAENVCLLQTSLRKTQDSGLCAAARAANATLIEQDRLLFIGILSKPQHFAERDLCRKAYVTALREANVKGCVRASFYIGHEHFSSAKQGAKPTLEQIELERRLAEEQKLYGDVVRLPLPEEYQNLPDKVLQVLDRGVRERYAFILKVDDDHVPTMNVIMNNIEQLDPKGLFYAGKYLWDPELVPFVDAQKGPRGDSKSYFSGPIYLLSYGLAKMIADEDMSSSAAFMSYGTSAEDLDMGYWVSAQKQRSGQNVKYVEIRDIGEPFPDTEHARHAR